MLRLWAVLLPLLGPTGATSGAQDGEAFSSVINLVIVLSLFVGSFIFTAVALLIGAYFYSFSRDTRSVSSPREMKGKTVIVTGANSETLTHTILKTMLKRIYRLVGNRGVFCAKRCFSSGIKDIYADEEEKCPQSSPKKRIGNMIVEEEKPYECRIREKAVNEDDRPDCWKGKKGVFQKKHTPVSHVIFNLDGVVLDSEKLIHEAHSYYLQKFKKGFPNKLKIQTSGLSELDVGKLLIYELRLNEIMPGITDTVYAQGARQHFRKLLNRINLMPEVNNLICHLYLNNIPIALASSNTEAMFKMKTRCFSKVLEKFCHITLRSDPEVKKGKPDPDMMFVSMKKFRNGPSDKSRFLAIEDSVVGARAAKAAGMQVVLLPSRPIPPEMAAQEADMVVDKLSEIDLTLFSLPKYPQGMQYN